MPAPGQQHKATAVAANPFEEAIPHIIEYTAQEIATLQSRLNKQLGPEYISSRKGPGGSKLHYVTAEKCIQLANEVFGFNGWSSSIREVQVDYVEELPSGCFNMGISVIMRVTLRNGTYHEDIGYGHYENCKTKAQGFEKTKKEATTDGLKRALRNFGNVLGNCIYDKDYVSKVTRMKIAPTKFDPENLHRSAEYAPVKKETPTGSDGIRASDGDSRSIATLDGEDEFGMTDFDEVDFSVAESGHPDEVSIEAPVRSGHFPKGSPMRNTPNSALQRSSSGLQNSRPPPPLPPNAMPKAPALPTTNVNGATNTSARMLQPHSLPPPQLAGIGQGAQASRQLNPQQHIVPSNRPAQVLPPQQHPPPMNRPLPQQAQPPRLAPQQPLNGNTAPAQRVQTSSGATSNSDSPSHPTDIPVPANAPIGFFSARVAETIQAPPPVLPAGTSFNPHAESPSIRKTAGFDHTKSKPVGREVKDGQNAPAASSPNGAAKSNFINPTIEQARRIGMPPNPTSPMGNRGSYKPPTLKRPLDSANLQQPQRPALGDVTNSFPPSGPPDPKRPRMIPGQALQAGANTTA